MNRSLLSLLGSAGIVLATVAAPFAQVDVELVGRINLPNSIFLLNVVGYIDPVTQREYAIACDNHDKVYIVDVEDPSDMRIVSQISGVPGFDVKTWDTYLYTCDGNQGGRDSRVVDISDVANPIVIPQGFYSAHTLQVSEAGVLFAEYPGLRMYDITATPTAPTLLHESGGEGHDSMPKGTDRLYDFHGRDDTVIWDVTDPANAVVLGVIDDPRIIYNHSGDVTADGRYLYICDELSTGVNADISIWNIENPQIPFRVGEIRDNNATVHNFYVVGDLGYAAYYSAGFRVYDLTDPDTPVLVGQYDTTKRTGEGFIGAIGAYVYLPSGNIFVCDVENGLFAFTVTPAIASNTPEESDFVLSQNIPNPFNPSTRIPFEVTRAGRVSLSIYDVAGRRVRRVLDREFAAGAHAAEWDGHDDAGLSVASGVYFYRMQSGARTETRRMVLLK